MGYYANQAKELNEANDMNDTKEKIVSTNKTSKTKKQAPKAYKANVKGKKPEQIKIDYVALLHRAVTEKGVINAAYRAFHNYSLGNQMLAADQLISRGLGLTPIASYNAWKDKGRQVIKGQKAIALFMPITFKSKSVIEEAEAEGVIEEKKRTALVLKNNWFSYEQTEGAEYAPEVKTPAWDATKAMAALNITEVPFESLNGNRLGYAQGREIAVNPMNNLKHKTRFHEMAHIVLGHTEHSNFSDMEVLPKDIKEAEAEGVAFILTSILELDGQAESRGYIQSWLDGKELPEENAKRIFVAANKIMEAGQ